MRSTRALVPVYLVHYKAPEWCARSVQSILRSRGVYPQVVVVDNGGGDDLRNLVPPEVRVIETGANLGFAGGANRAIEDWRMKYPDAALLVIGSHDLQLEENALEALVEAASSHPGFGILAPFVAGREHRIPRERGPGPVIRVEWVSGSCMLLKSACLETVRGFDETFGSYVEDVEFCLRADDLGWPTGVVVNSHAHGLGTAHEWERDILIEVNSVLLAQKRGGWRSLIRAIIRLNRRILRTAISVSSPWQRPEVRKHSYYWLRVRAVALGRIGRALASGAWKSQSQAGHHD